jgi:hypothetical protein
MKMISLYPYSDVYQVLHKQGTTVLFQGTYMECFQYMLQNS